MHLRDQRGLLDWRTLKHGLVISVVQHLLGLHREHTGCCMVEGFRASSHTPKAMVWCDPLESVLLSEMVLDIAATKERVHALASASTAVGRPRSFRLSAFGSVSHGILLPAVVGWRPHVLKRNLLARVQLRVATVRAVVFKLLDLSG